MHGARPMLSFALVRGRERFARGLWSWIAGAWKPFNYTAVLYQYNRSHHLANPSSVRREGKRKALMRAKAQGLPFPSHFKVCVPSRQPAMEVVYGTID